MQRHSQMNRLSGSVLIANLQVMSCRMLAAVRTFRDRSCEATLFAMLVVLVWPQSAHADIPDLVEQAKESVVMVLAYRDEGSRDASLGTGWVFDDGLVVTNHHVIANAVRVVIQRSDKGTGDRRHDATGVMGFDVKHDLAVLRVDWDNDVPPSMSLADNLPRVGERVYAIGNPRGLEHSVSDGIVSAIRDFNDIEVIQISAPISPGSSGSPVFTRTGDVVGVATFARRDGQSLNFAIPVRALRSIDVSKLIGFDDWSQQGPERGASSFGEEDRHTLYDGLYKLYRDAQQRVAASRGRASSARPQLEFAPSGSAIGHLDGRYRVFQILGDSRAIMSQVGARGRREVDFHISGIDLSNWIDGQIAGFNRSIVFFRIGTYRYTTTTGASRTIYDVEALDTDMFNAARQRYVQRLQDSIMEAQVRQGQLRAQRKEAEDDLRDFREQHATTVRYLRLKSDVDLYRQAANQEHIAEKIRGWQRELDEMGTVDQETIEAYQNGLDEHRDRISQINGELRQVSILIQERQAEQDR